MRAFRVTIRNYFYSLELYRNGANVFDLDEACQAAENEHGNSWEEVYNGQEGLSRDEWLEKRTR